MSTLEERFARALHSTTRVWRLALDRRLKDLGLSQAGWMTIAIVAKAEAPLSQIELAQRVGVEGSTMVAMVDRLVKSGLLERQPSPSDRRVRFVVLTEPGNQTYARVKAEADAFRMEVMAGVDADALRVAAELLEHIEQVVSAAV
ncbi:MarR family transcriptional regulator [Uliginosibacterium sp. H3]|uniref:MarR family transcriptional regulator n=1 Tax=Uliginosibacterium silvisoli TaxID=3114758 RepID=A0ABU6JZ09_9RHOO|nr:MarR family transcriptional regulator [Uliginosibacterium sp. H3]